MRVPGKLLMKDHPQVFNLCGVAQAHYPQLQIMSYFLPVEKGDYSSLARVNTKVLLLTPLTDFIKDTVHKLRHLSFIIYYKVICIAQGLVAILQTELACGQSIPITGFTEFSPQILNCT